MSWLDSKSLGLIGDRSAYLNGACEEVSIMRSSGGKRRSIVKRKLRATFRKLETRLERVDLPPELDGLFFLSSKIEGRGNYRKFCGISMDDLLKSTYCRAEKMTSCTVAEEQ
jgi:hypothetical protein